MRRPFRRAMLTVAAPAGAVLRAVGGALPGLLGLALVSYGAWLAWPPAGFMAAGVLLLADRVWEHTRANGRQR